jgi:hypothetical protein
MRSWGHAAFGALLAMGHYMAGGCAKSKGPEGTLGSAASSGTSGAGGSPDSGPCETADDCKNGQVCDPAAHACVSDLSCEKHADCGTIAYCSNDVCAPSVAGAPCDDSSSCIMGEACSNGFCGCGGELYDAQSVPANVLIVLDRSSSMDEPIPGGTKWTVAKQAIIDILGAYGGAVHFGLMLYPGTDLSGMKGATCGPGVIFVDPGPQTSSAIITTLAGAGTTMFDTPTAESLTALVNYEGLKDPKRENTILLVTDGQSTCNDPVPVVAKLYSGSPSIKTFVVGFGDGVNPMELNSLAKSGGTAHAQLPFYYKASDGEALGAAFQEIAGKVLSCAYVLAKTPPDPNELYVYVDGKELLEGTQDGWVYDAATNQITFSGATCDALKGGTAKEVLISYGCPLGDLN